MTFLLHTGNLIIMSNPEELLTPQEVSVIKRVHVKSVYRAIDEGRLKAARRGKRIFLIRRADTEEWRARRGRFKESDG